MSNEWLTREVLRRVKYFEEYVMSGGDGFIAMLELMRGLMRIAWLVAKIKGGGMKMVTC